MDRDKNMTTIQIDPKTIQAVPDEKNGKHSLLSIRKLNVWFELRRWGFGVAGYVRAVDNVNFDLIMVKPSRWWVRAAAENPA
jgi:ABC-type glutathione transport system ATPase component